MGEIFINEEEMRQNTLKMLNDELLVGLTGMYDYFEEKYNKKEPLDTAGLKGIEAEFTLKVLKDLFEGRIPEAAEKAKEMTEQHLSGKIRLNNEIKSLSLQYYVDKNNVSYFGSLSLEDEKSPIIIEDAESYDRQTLEIFREGLSAELKRATTVAEGLYVDFKNMDQLVGLVLDELFDGHTHTGTPSPDMVKQVITGKAKIGGVLKEIRLTYAVNLKKRQYFAVSLEKKDVAWS
jgi:hypothetical protein